MLGRVVVVAVLASAGAARADVVQTLKSGAVVDWTRGVVTARGVGPADRHAPSPAVARDAARVRAEAAARAALTAAAKALPGVKAAELDGAALTDAIAHATLATMELGTDGSVTVELALPIEAVRIAAAGARRVEPAADPAPAVVIVDARKAGGKPVVGVTVTGQGGASWSGPTLFVDAVPADGIPMVGAHPVRVTATKAGARSIAIDGDLPAPGALVVVVIGGKS